MQLQLLLRNLACGLDGSVNVDIIVTLYVLYALEIVDQRMVHGNTDANYVSVIMLPIGRGK